MSSSPKAPAPPDYIGAARETAKGNLENIKYQTEANRVNQHTDFGSTEWTQDANGRWTQTQTLAPDIKGTMDAQNQQQLLQAQLAQKLQGQVDKASDTPFSGPSFSSYLSNVPSVNTNFRGFNGSSTPQINANFGSFNSSGVPALDTTAREFNTGNFPSVNTNFGSFGSRANPVNQASTAYTQGAGTVDLNAPQFDQSMVEGATKAAYDSQMGLLQEDFDKGNTDLDAKLRLQGLTPGTEAYNDAMQTQLKTQGQMRTQAANNAVMTGNDIANRNYASALAGYGAKLGAQGQAFGQGMTSFGADNAASDQAFGRDASTFGINQQSTRLGNEAQSQQFQQALAAYGANQSGVTNANAARGQAFGQELAKYGANQTSQQLSNDALGDIYSRALAEYTTGQDAISKQNQAQDQAYGQASDRYQQDYSRSQSEYMMPLNMLGSLNSGSQVGAPQMPSYAMAGATSGPDLLGATSAQAQYNQGLYNSQSAAAAANNAAYANLFGTLLSSYFGG